MDIVNIHNIYNNLVPKNEFKNQDQKIVDSNDLELKEVSINLSNTFKTLLLKNLFAEQKTDYQLYQNEWVSQIIATNHEMDPLAEGIYEQLKQQQSNDKKISITT